MCVGDDLCYFENTAIKIYLNLPETRALLGVESPSNFTACSSDVGRGFGLRMDKWASPTQNYVSGLLDRGIRVLIYAGTYDWQCNWVANKLWVDKLQWSGQDAYATQEWRDWFTVDDHKAGETKTSGALTFATIRGAGHMMSVILDVLPCISKAKNCLSSTFPMTSRRSRGPWSPDGSQGKTYEGVLRGRSIFRCYRIARRVDTSCQVASGGGNDLLRLHQHLLTCTLLVQTEAMRCMISRQRSSTL